MLKRIDNKVDPFSTIRMLPDRPLFADCPVKPSDETIDAAEELYLKFSHDPPSYVSYIKDKIVFEWQYYRKDKLLRDEILYSKELVFHNKNQLEWREFNYT